MPSDRARKLKVTALLSGEPAPHDLWTLRQMASVDCELTALEAPRLLVEHPRKLGAAVGMRLAARDQALLKQLFDFEDLSSWWSSSGIGPVKVRALNDDDSHAALTALSPDVIVRVSGGMPDPRIYSIAALAALNIHHGQAPLIRGMWSIPWGIIEGRRDWIGATVHFIDNRTGTGPILWRGGPQLAPGDTNIDLFFRAHLEASDALGRILRVYADGGIPRPWIPAAGEITTHKPAPGLLGWLRLLCLDRGRRAHLLLERGIEC